MKGGGRKGGREEGGKGGRREGRRGVNNTTDMK